VEGSGLQRGEGCEFAGQFGALVFQSGFHLGHAGITQNKIDRTVDELDKRKVAWVSPMHCSGFRAQRAVAERMPDAFKHMTAGTEVRFVA